MNLQLTINRPPQNRKQQLHWLGILWISMSVVLHMTNVDHLQYRPRDTTGNHSGTLPTQVNGVVLVIYKPFNSSRV